MAVKVLILEGNPVARGFLCRVVRESFSDDMAITEAPSLQAARHHLASSGADPFRLVLVDLELADGDGLALLAELAAYPACCIATTLYADDEHLYPALQRGADGYLLKEDRFELLVEELQKIVRGHPPLSPAIARRMLAHFRASPTAAALTPRENELLTFLSKGFTSKEIAGLLSLQGPGLNDALRAIYGKFAAASRPA